MQDQEIRLLHLAGDAARRGSIHGQAHTGEIRRFAAERLELSGTGTTLGRDELLALAESCVPAHEAYSSDLTEEMAAMAAAAGISLAEAIVAGGYTDLLDLVRAHAAGARTVDECTAVIVPDGLADGSGYLAQTWDMDASAMPYVVMLRLEPDRGPAALVFSTVGCLGQIGMNEAGLAVGINNLTADDGQVGVTWPLVVRKALQQTDIESALSCVIDANLSGGHNFLLFDRGGKGYSIEAMPTAKEVSVLDSEILAHTNHCLADVTAQAEATRPADLQLSSQRRLADAISLVLTRPVTERALMDMLGDERSICRRPAPPWFYASCGAVIMRPGTGDMWACWGIPADNEFEHFSLEPSQV